MLRDTRSLTLIAVVGTGTPRDIVTAPPDRGNIHVVVPVVVVPGYIHTTSNPGYIGINTGVFASRSVLHYRGLCYKVVDGSDTRW